MLILSWTVAKYPRHLLGDFSEKNRWSPRIPYCNGIDLTKLITIQFNELLNSWETLLASSEPGIFILENEKHCWRG